MRSFAAVIVLFSSGCSQSEASVDAAPGDVSVEDALVTDGSPDASPDGPACVTPMNDTCLDPLAIHAAGAYVMNTGCAAFDYATSCGLGDMPEAADVVAAVVLPAGPLVDVEVTAHSSAPVSVTIAGQCGDAATELACGASQTDPQGGNIATARGRALGSTTQSSAYAVYVSTLGAAEVSLDVAFLTPAPLSCSLATNVNTCSNGPIPQISVGQVGAGTCKTTCETQMAAAGMTSGCWIIGADLHCYCRSGEVMTVMSPSTLYGGSCQ